MTPSLSSGVFATAEAVRGGERLLATYYLELDAETDVLGRAAAFAVGQTIGTWIDVPGVTQDMRQHHRGQVIRVLEAPPVDLRTQAEGQTHGFFVQLALPTVNFGAQFPMMLTTLLGNDASTSVQAKLVDLELPDSFAAAFGGPKYGTAGVRDLVGVHDRPLTLNMIKPCTGLTPEQGAKIFHETALGGIDLIKDDELLGNPDFSPVDDRVRAYASAARRAADVTGRETLHIVNVTDRPDRILDTARRAVDAGARAIMVTYATVGYGVLQSLAEQVGVPILGHFAGSGMFFEGPSSGMSAPLAAGLLPRMAGADMALVTTPYGGYPIRRLQYLRTILELTLPRPHLAATMPVIGGGVHPGVVGRYVKDAGIDIILGAGGSVQGHPEGAAAGARALRQAVDAAATGQDVEDAATEHPELATALELWGVHH